jgi:2-keto-4-pentenoate hydratase/2-oxohepta-3-ene-1,7-dioic acid hydratase in catechol pathway
MFRLLNVDGRAALEVDGRWFDLAAVAGDDALDDPMVAVARFDELGDLAAACTPERAGGPVDEAVLGPPVPRPGQVFGIGLNYADHAAESGMEKPPAPLTFTKFPTSIAGPTADVPLSGEMVDWEVEIVAVVGRPAHRVATSDAWSVLAGLTLGQDISDRLVQLTGAPPQFSLGKSFPGYSPIGPALVSIDSFAEPDDLALRCEVSGERMQDSRTANLIFAIPTLVAYLSSICPLGPGDLIFTGTPDGVGMAKGRFLVPGDEVVSWAEGIGELRNRCIAGEGPMPL